MSRTLKIGMGFGLVLAVGVGVAWRLASKHHSLPVEAAADDVAAAAERPALPRGAGEPSPGVRSVQEAAATHQHPERLSPLFAPRPFDREAFEANPRAYLDVVEPARCYQSAANPGPDTPRLTAMTHTSLHGRPGETVMLAVHGAPAAPVTFTAFERGHFVENGLSSVSVRSDAHGLATAYFQLPENANAARVPIVAGSPLATGRQTFIIRRTETVAAN